MAETTTAEELPTTTGVRGDLETTYTLLKVVYGLVPIVAGLDKFTNLLVTWTDYLPTVVVDVLPVEPALFMYVVGVVEIVAGIVVLSRYTEYGAYLVAAWLVGVAATLLVSGYYDVAVRDVVMAVGAVALAQLAAARHGG